MTKPNAWKIVQEVLLVCTVLATMAPAQVVTTITQLSRYGYKPIDVSLARGRDGHLYGTTYVGGGPDCDEACGSAFVVTQAGSIHAVHFCQACSYGSNPMAGVILGTDGNLYGTTAAGGMCGPGNCGAVFKLTPSGVLSTLVSFDGNNGFQPYAPLLEAPDGYFYGTTSGGFSENTTLGTVFKVDSRGELTTLYNFCTDGNACSDGYLPFGGLALASDGNFYGTTYSGGEYSAGTVFRITPSGHLTTIHSFCQGGGQACPDGTALEAGLIQGSDGNLYGSTMSNGIHFGGTVFRISQDGVLTTLYSFCAQGGRSCSDGTAPAGVLSQGTDGNFYGVTNGGGASLCRCGTIFQLTPQGNLTTLYSFTDGDDGEYPQSGLTQATDGSFYGTTIRTVFRLDMGLGPFVAFVVPAGKVGQTAEILGQGFTGTTAVSLNGIPMNFKIVSDTYLTATVPSGATTGYVTVTTPTGVLKSNVPFNVIP